MKKSNAFTLVELLVVIGIIALLVGILLPALAAARRQAEAVKCEASLREIGNAVFMYVQDNHGYAPPCKLRSGVSPPAGNYNLNGFNFDTYDNDAVSCYWFNFIAKYATKTAVGNAANAGNSSQQTNSVLWGCPAWTGYQNSTLGGTNVTQPGYGMNGFPDYTASFPPLSANPQNTASLGEAGAYPTITNQPTYAGPGWSNFTNEWPKFTVYARNGSERALAGDCLFWFMESWAPLNPPKMAGQYMLLNQLTWGMNGQDHNETSIDWYRHGKYPTGLNPGTSDELATSGGKVSYNILFCDGHVANETDKSMAYRVVRMRYPG